MDVNPVQNLPGFGTPETECRWQGAGEGGDTPVDTQRLTEAGSHLAPGMPGCLFVFVHEDKKTFGREKRMWLVS
jgi:hypothetical protein